MPDPDYPRCKTCEHWTPSGVKPFITPPEYGDCHNGVSDTPNATERTARDFGCVRHSSVTDTDE